MIEAFASLTVGPFLVLSAIAAVARVFRGVAR